MGIGGWISAILVGLVIGYLGRIVAPRNHGPRPGFLLTILIGIVAAVAGTAAGRGLHVHAFAAIFALQLVCAAVFVTGFGRLARR
jgi:uncharacterized membrane protein YeaQ/YmgE (transglycosylase-associated protein family)